MSVNGTIITLTAAGGRRNQEIVFGLARRTSRPSKTPPTPAAYCNRIVSSVYEQQKQQMDQDLLGLLDTILADENMRPASKREKLKTFQITYPRVYAQRFPRGLEDSNVNLHSSIITNSRLLVQGSGKKNLTGGSGRLLTRFRQMMMTS